MKRQSVSSLFLPTVAFMIFLICAACVPLAYSDAPAASAAVPQAPRSIVVPDLLLTQGDLSGLGNDWKITGSSDVHAQWGSLPVTEAYSVWLLNDSSHAMVDHEVLYFQNAADLARYWPVLSELSVENEWNYARPINVLAVESLPALHADHVAIRCEEYSDDRDHFNDDKHWCAVRLVYGPIYTQLTAKVGPNGVPPQTIYKIVALVDTHMSPIWSN